MKKTLVIMVVSLLIIPFASHVKAADQSNTIYVDDDNTEGPWDGSWEYPYQHVQDGIDAVIDEDTVFVHPGIYEETIQLSMQIHLVGANKKTTFVFTSEPSECLLVESVNFVVIENFTFSCNNDQRFDIIKIINSTHCTISNVDITSETLQRSAIKVNGSFNTIENVFIKGRYFFSGVEVIYGSCNTIANNSIESSSQGILLSRSHNNMVSSNELSNNTNGIYIEEGNQNSILSNTLRSNSRGLFSTYSTRNRIEKNDFIDNEIHAKFTKLFKFGFFLPNSWNNNYWDDYKGFLMKPIPGVLYVPNRNLFGFFFPWFEFDRSPSFEPLNES